MSIKTNPWHLKRLLKFLDLFVVSVEAGFDV